jgi:serine phosphatase RsbU (regulator of sigma subunit)
VPLGSFPEIVYDEVTLGLSVGDVFVFCSDGIFEAMNEVGGEFGAERLMEVIQRTRTQPARAMTDAIFGAAIEFRGDALQNDDMTAVVLKVTA